MKGHVQTPSDVAEHMVQYLFEREAPDESDRILYPGCGSEAPFVQAISEYCQSAELSVPPGVAFETHPERITAGQEKHQDKPVEFLSEDFLQPSPDWGTFEYIIGNPPYVPIEDIKHKTKYKRIFDTATDRFDLYILFFERALQLLTDGGRLVFVTPEKFEYTETTESLRSILTSHKVTLIEHLPEDTFEGYSTYPTISVTDNQNPDSTRVIRRDGSEDTVDLPTDGSSWAPYVRDISGDALNSNVTLGEVTERISPGMATGRDAIFVQSTEEIPTQLVDEGWTYPTISGRQLRVNDGPSSQDLIICPYDEHGDLLKESELGAFQDWAELHRDELESRSCVENGKAWYAWHENPPMEDIVEQPKLLCQDLAEEPEFWIDETGEILPRHSVYYIVPQDHIDLEDLLMYLRSDETKAWLEAHCHRASDGYIRLQSTVLQDLPVPESFWETHQTTIT